MATKKLMIGVLTFLSCALLLIAVCSTVILAAFTSNKNANANISFHPGIDMTVSGINNNGKWLYKVNNQTTYTENGNNVAPTTSLALSPISVTVTKGITAETPTIYVRIFVLISTTNNTSAELNAITGSTTLTTRETGLTNNKSLGYAHIESVTAMNSAKQIFASYEALNSALQSDVLSCKVTITASTKANPDWDTLRSFTFSI